MLDIEEKNKEISNDKLNADHSNDAKPYITETYKNGTSEYCIWSDSRCEQSFQISVTTGNKDIDIPLLLELDSDTYFPVITPVITKTIAPTTAIKTKQNNSFVLRYENPGAAASSVTSLQITVKGHLKKETTNEL